jgi:hypothetical protein
MIIASGAIQLQLFAMAIAEGKYVPEERKRTSKGLWPFGGKESA